MNELALFNNFFENAFNDSLPEFNFSNFSVPKVDVKENKESYMMQMDLPGMSEKDVKLELDHNVLTISSHHEECKEEKKDDSENKDEVKYLLRERRVSDFSRRFALPDDVDSEKVSAAFKNGVLTVNIPRKEIASPKRIAITAA